MPTVHESGFIRSCEKHVIEANKKYWKDRYNVTDGTEWIYVFHSVAEEFEAVIREDIFAKGLQEEKKLPIVSVFCVNKQPSGDEIDLSFGIQHIIHLIPEKFDSFISRIRTYLWAKYYSMRTYNKKHKLFQIRYRGILCGNAISDTIIREGSLDASKNHEFNFDCFDISPFCYYKHIRRAFSIIDHAYAMFKKKKPSYVITAEKVYSQSLVINVANTVGATIFMMLFGQANTIHTVLPGNPLPSISDQTERSVKKFLKENPIDLNDGTLENVGNLLPEKELKNDSWPPLELRNGKKNIFIMLHALADVPREVCRQPVYNDYNEWFLDTMRIIKDIKGVNWIIKDHPAATFYGQDHYIKRIYDQNRSENIFWCDKSIGRREIIEIADCIVTCVGTAGIEYWTYGIPTITVAEIYYAKWGVSYNMKSVKEYEETLRHINELARPTDESILTAQKILYALQKMGLNRKDELAAILTETYLERVGAFCLNGNKGESPTYHFCRKFLLYLEQNDVTESGIYQHDNIAEQGDI